MVIFEENEKRKIENKYKELMNTYNKYKKLMEVLGIEDKPLMDFEEIKRNILIHDNP